jgi:hypothetical protein
LSFKNFSASASAVEGSTAAIGVRATKQAQLLAARAGVERHLIEEAFVGVDRAVGEQHPRQRVHLFRVQPFPG